MDSNILLSRLCVDSMIAEAKKIHEELKREVETATSSAQLEEIRGMIECGVDDIRLKLREELLPIQFCVYLNYLIRRRRLDEKRRLKMSAKGNQGHPDHA